MSNKFLVIATNSLFTTSESVASLEDAKKLSEQWIRYGYDEVEIFEKRFTAAVKEPEVTFTGV